MGDEAAGCFSCCVEAEGDDCIEAIASGAIFTADGERRQPTTWQSKLAAAFFVINFLLTLVDAVFGGISIHDTLQKFRESNQSIVGTTENYAIFSNTTESILLSPTTTPRNSLISNLSIPTDVPVTSTYASISSVLPEDTTSSAVSTDDGKSGLTIWVSFYVVFCVIYLPFETLMVIYMLFGFRSLVYKCRRRQRSKQTSNNVDGAGMNHIGNKHEESVDSQELSMNCPEVENGSSCNQGYTEDITKTTEDENNSAVAETSDAVFSPNREEENMAASKHNGSEDEECNELATQHQNVSINEPEVNLQNQEPNNMEDSQRITQHNLQQQSFQPSPQILNINASDPSLPQLQQALDLQRSLSASYMPAVAQNIAQWTQAQHPYVPNLGQCDIFTLNGGMGYNSQNTPYDPMNYHNIIGTNQSGHHNLHDSGQCGIFVLNSHMINHPDNNQPAQPYNPQPSLPSMPGIHDVEEKIENEEDMDLGCFDRDCGCFSRNDDLKEIPIEFMLLFESILLNMMSYGQLAFSQSSYTNRQIYIEGLNIAETSGVIVTTSVVTYILTFGHLFKARNRLKVGFRGWKPWMKFLFRFVEFFMSGIAMTSAIMVLRVATGGRLYIFSGGLFYSIFLWSLISHAGTLLLLTEKGRIILICILDCICSGNKK